MRLSSPAFSTFSILMVGSLMWIGSLPARADTDFSECHLPRRVTMTKKLADIPQPVLAHLPGLGAANEAILSEVDDPSDPISDNIPSVRLAAAFAEGARWAVVYETGDFAKTRTVMLFSVMQRKASIIRQQASRQGTGVCALLNAAFPD